MICIFCSAKDCETIHTLEEIRAKEFKGCYICREFDCIKSHSIEELRNPLPPSKEEVRVSLQILIAYDKLLNNGDDQVSTE